MKKIFCLIVLAAVCMSAFSCVQKIQPASTVTDEATVTESRPTIATEAPETEPASTEPPETAAESTSEPVVTEPPTTEAPTTEAPATEPPTTEPPATEPPTTEAPATEPPTTEAPVTEPPKPKEFESVQPSHTTPDDVENPTNIYESGAVHTGSGVGIVKMAPPKVYFKVYDCGYEQFEKLLAMHDQFDKSLISPDTSKYREKTAAGKLKIWLCTLDGEKIDYVYANKNGIVGFTLRPGEYTVKYEDDGKYKTLYSSVVKVEPRENKNGPATSLVRIVNPLGYTDDTLKLHIYNYKWYKPVTVTVKDGSGKPLAGVYVAYQSYYLTEGFEDRYYKTDKNGKLKLSCIFDLINKIDLNGMNSWHSDIQLYFEKEGYESVTITDGNTRKTEFEVTMKKQ